MLIGLLPAVVAIHSVYIRTLECDVACRKVRGSDNTHHINTESCGCQRYMTFVLFFTYATYSGAAAASSFINLVIKESDNNVKLIVLDRLDALRSKHGHVLDGLIMDVLQVLSRYRFFVVCLVL